MSISWPALALLGAGLLLYTATVIADTALALASHHEIRKRVEQREPAARRVDYLFAHKRAWMTTAVLLRVGALLAAGSTLLRLVTPIPSTLWLVVLVICVWLGFAAAQLVGRLWVQHSPTRAALRLATFMRFTVALLAPVNAILGNFAERLKDGAELDEDSIVVSQDGVRLVLPNDGEDTEIEESEKEMITSILEMDETVASEVMVPRVDMVAIEADVSLAEALDVIMEAGHSRIPVYDDSVDQIVGLLYAKDLLKCFQQARTDASVRDLLRPAYFVPLTKNVKNLLAEMRKHRVHIAIVVDEYGGTAGLVTIEDILEEIVGEIQDEYDQAEEILVQRTGTDGYLIAGRLDVYSLAKLLDIEIDDDDADTVGGFLLSLFGRVPEPGNSLEHEGWRFTILTVDGRRIDKVRVEPVAHAQPQEAPAQTHEKPAPAKPAPNSI